MTPQRSVTVPLSIFQQDISALGLRLWCVLKYFAGHRGRCHPSRRLLARFLPPSDLYYDRFIKTAAAELQDAKLLEIEPRFDDRSGAQLSNLYVLRAPSYFKKIGERSERERSARGGDKFIPPGGIKTSPLKIVKAVLPLAVESFDVESGSLKRDRRGAAAGRPPNGLHARKENGNGHGPRQKVENERNRPNFERKHRGEYEDRAPRGFRPRLGAPGGKDAMLKKLWQQICGVYEKHKRVPMPAPGRRDKILRNLVSVYQPAGVRALWAMWWERGPWSRYAQESGHSLEAFDRSIDSLLDRQERYYQLRQKFTSEDL